jgi:CheY-like chemotaxis protein
VLVVDDDEASRTVVAAHLENHSATVLTAASAAEAMRLLTQERIDVLLADIAMPGEDGYTLLRRVRALKGSAVSAVPAAALTAFARDEDRRAALAAGFQLHLTKPIDAGSLVAAVATLGRTPPPRRVSPLEEATEGTEKTGQDHRGGTENRRQILSVSPVPSFPRV